MPASTRLPARALARGHLGALLAVAFAIFGGTALISAGAVLTETSLSAQAPPERLAGAAVLVSAPQQVEVVEDFDVRLTERAPVPTALAGRIADVPGVAAAAADVTFPVSLTAPGSNRTVTDDAHSWAVAALGDPALRGTAPRTTGDVVVNEEAAESAGLAVGDRLDLTVGDAHRSVRITGIVDSPGAVHLAPVDAAALAPLPDGVSDLIAVGLSEDADTAEVTADIEDAVGGDYTVTTGDARGAVESLAIGNARGELLELAASLAGILLLLVGFITAGALAISVANQRRELALLRAVGATPRQIRSLVARQASLAALVGLAPGVALGYVLAGWFCDELARAGVVSTALPVAYTPIAGLTVAALTLLVVQCAARLAVWRASRRPATEAMGDAQVEPRRPSRIRTATGLTLIAASLAPAFLALVIPGEEAFLSAVSGTLLGIVGLAVAGPALARTITGRLARRSDGRTSATGWLALNNTHAYALRTAGSVSVLALAIGLTLTQVYAQSTLEDVTRAEQSAGMIADMRISGPLTAGDVTTLAATPGVDAAVPLVSTTVLRTSRTLGDATAERYPALGVGPEAPHVLDLDVAAGDLADLRGDSIALDVNAARRWGVGVGDRTELRLGNGVAVNPLVVATYRRGFGFGGVIASTDLLTSHGLARSLDTVLVDGDSAAVTAWAEDHPAHAVASGSSLNGVSDVDRWISLIVLVPMLGYVLVAVGNSLRTATGRRREELALLRMVGATPRQIRAMVTREAALISALAITAGLILSVLPMSVLALGVVGRPWPQGPLWLIPAVSIVVALIATGSMRAATRRILQRPVMG
ncbi:ABC transporter permease [Mumia sp. zg.B17]|uniref:FtsX-like permease family protein n=1 Tax=Mumia sp. zg.B17 TaxID=2855446 RepID=UPI001C6E2F1F|nr:ABC transporter permease [Mumia sp. zg.B17]MBW9206323.1 ABC transporter permease [Mumia sp. zg.B17]